MHKRKIIIIIIVCLICFGNTLFNQFVGDDEFVIVKNSLYKSLSNVSILFSSKYNTVSDNVLNNVESDLGSGSVAYRPVLTLSYFADYAIWKINPFGYHLTNLIIHLLNSILVYLILFLLLNNASLSLFVALVFCVHPLKVESVCSIGYRADLLSGFFVFLSFYFNLKIRKFSKLNVGNNNFYVLLFYFLAVFTKESALVYPALILGYEFLFSGEKFKFDIKSLLIRYWGLIVISIFFLCVYFFVFPNSALDSARLIRGDIALHILSSLKIFSDYVLNFVMPFLVKILPPFYVPSISSLFGLSFVVSIVVFLIFIVCILKAFRRNKLSSFFIIWFLLFLLPVLNIIPLVNPVAYRYLYLPSFGIIAAVFIYLDTFIVKIGHQFKFNNLSMMFRFWVVGLCMVTTFPLNLCWHDSYTLAFRMRGDYPDQPSGYLYSAMLYLNANEVEKAKEYFLKALDLGMVDPRLYYGLGMIELTNTERSKYYFSQSIINFPTYAAGYFGYARALLFEGDYSRAILFLNNGLKLAPRYSAYGYLIQIYLIKGDGEKAEKVLNEALNKITKKDEIDSLKKFLDGEKRELPIDIGV